MASPESATAVLTSIKCGSCGHTARQYTNLVGDTYLLPQELPVDVIRRASQTTICMACGAALALFELAASS